MRGKFPSSVIRPTEVSQKVLRRTGGIRRKIGLISPRMRGRFPSRVIRPAAAVGAAILILLTIVPPGCRSEAPRQEVVLYCSADQQVAEPIIAEFQRQTGITVLARFDTEADKTVSLVNRLRAEAAHPAADVFWSNEVFYTIRLAREGLLAPYEGDNAAVLAWPEAFRDGPRRWHGFALRARVIAYGTRRVAADQAPGRLEDLLDGRWKDRIVMASPEAGTTGGDVASWLAHYGKGRAEEIMRGLKANRIRLAGSNSAAVQMIVAGQADVALTDTDDVYAAQRDGKPVAMKYLDQGGDGALVIPNTVAVMKGGPHPAAARRLVEFLLSERAERMLAEGDSHNAPVGAAAKDFPALAIPRPLRVDPDAVVDCLPAAIEMSREILR